MREEQECSVVSGSVEIDVQVAMMMMMGWRAYGEVELYSIFLRLPFGAGSSGVTGDRV